MPNRDPYVVQELLSHQVFLRRLATDLAGEDADDLVQEVWRRALESPPRHVRQVRGWLARVARNLAANRWRDEARRAERERGRASEPPAGDELAARFELHKELVDALDSLGQSYRETILLRYFDGLAPREIATRQGAPVATVKKRLRRGLEQLREALDKRHGGDRATWMSAVAGLAAPVNGGGGTATLTIGGVAMGTVAKVSAGILVVAACLHFATRTPQVEVPRVATIEPLAANGELPETDELAGVPEAESPTTEARRRTAVAEEPPVDVTPALPTNVLRVVIEGITEEVAREAEIALAVWDERGRAIEGIRASWLCQGSTSDFDLDPIFASVADRGLSVGSLVGNVDHPLHLREPFELARSESTQAENGQTVFEVRATMSGLVFWPELTLAVRDEDTRAHLADVELHCIGTEFMNLRRQPGPSLSYSALGRGLNSPIKLMGGHEAGELDLVGAIALPPAAGEASQIVELAGRSNTDRGVIVYARAPGYEWGRINLDFSTSGERELLLGQGAALGVQLANVRLERYDALGTGATLFVYQSGWGLGLVCVRPLDETLAAEGLWVDGIEPGELTVSVELGSEWSSRRRAVLASETLSLAAGETRELVLMLPEPPAPTERVTLGGVLSFPAFGGEEDVRMQLYHADWSGGDNDVELSLAEMDPVGGALPTWSFRFEDVPVGTCQIQLQPFLKGWMVDVPPGGRDDVELTIPELAEVFVESVDARTGERVPLEKLRYIYKEELPGRVHHIWSDQIWTGFEGEPGLFRFWTAPGAAYLGTWKIREELGYSSGGLDLELVPGLQSVRLELAPPYAFRIELQVDGAALPYDDRIYRDLRQGIRAVGHEGQASHVTRKIAVVSAPGVYEITFEGVGADRFLTSPPQQVEVREGEMATVTVKLQRK
ncbi:MAG: RNA polymerase sigma factor [Planctomycetota bacterium]